MNSKWKKKTWFQFRKNTPRQSFVCHEPISIAWWLQWSLSVRFAHRTYGHVVPLQNFPCPNLFDAYWIILVPPRFAVLFYVPSTCFDRVSKPYGVPLVTKVLLTLSFFFHYCAGIEPYRWPHAICALIPARSLEFSPCFSPVLYISWSCSQSVNCQD